jgi:solute:Na+ symporter, SSS family
VGETEMVEISRSAMDAGSKVVVTRRKQGTFHGEGRMNLDYYIYHLLGMDLRKADKALLTTMRLPPRLIMPFVVMILLSLVTRPGSQRALDRYYVKMKTPVQPDPEDDRRELELSYEKPERFNHKKLFPGTKIEIMRPTFIDVTGFVVSVGICILFLALATWLANIGA